MDYLDEGENLIIDYSTLKEEEIIGLIDMGAATGPEIVKVLEDGKLKLETLFDYYANSEYTENFTESTKEIYKAIVNKATDEEKMQLLSKLEYSEHVDHLIYSLKKEENVIEAIDKYATEPRKNYEIAYFYNSDSLKLHYVPLMEDKDDGVELIRALSDQKIKMDCLQTMTDPISKAIIIESLDIPDEEKLKMLPPEVDEQLKMDIYLSLKKDETKIELIPSLELEENKIDLIRSLKKESNKEKQLFQIESEEGKAELIVDFKNDERKLRLINEINDVNVKTLLLLSLNNDEKKLKYLDEIKDKGHKTLLILSLKDEEKAKELLQELGVESKGKYKNFGLSPEITIGVEIESEGKNSSLIEKIGKILGWETKGDLSLNNGAEVVSYIMHDNGNDIKSIYNICSALKLVGQSIEDTCGGHIHIGANILKSGEAYKNLIEMWGNVELPLYLVCNEEGTLPREGIEKYAPQINPKIRKMIENGTVNIQDTDDIQEIINGLRKIQKNDRHSGINFLNVNYNNSKNTIEFRIPNGSLNPDTWIENVRLFGRLVEMAEKTAEIQLKDEDKRTEEEKIKLGLLESLKADIDDGEKLEILLEILFTEEEKDVYRKRYETNRKLYEELPESKKVLSKEKGVIALSNKGKKNGNVKKHEKGEMKEIAEGERYINIEKTMEESFIVEKDNHNSAIDYEVN